MKQIMCGTTRRTFMEDLVFADRDVFARQVVVCKRWVVDPRLKVWRSFLLHLESLQRNAKNV